MPTPLTVVLVFAFSIALRARCASPDKAAERKKPCANRSVRVSRATQQIPAALLPDTHQSRAARSILKKPEKLFLLYFQLLISTQPRLARRSQCRPASRCSTL
jgi:hypothetical protein